VRLKTNLSVSCQNHGIAHNNGRGEVASLRVAMSPLAMNLSFYLTARFLLITSYGCTTQFFSIDSSNVSTSTTPTSISFTIVPLFQAIDTLYEYSLSRDIVYVPEFAPIEEMTASFLVPHPVLVKAILFRITPGVVTAPVIVTLLGLKSPGVKTA
jgi:hypothetical protein